MTNAILVGPKQESKGHEVFFNFIFIFYLKIQITEINF